MPRYFFNSRNGELVCDAAGQDLADEGAARREAVRLMGAVLNDRPEELLLNDRWQLSVEDAHKEALFTIDVCVRDGGVSASGAR